MPLVAALVWQRPNGGVIPAFLSNPLGRTTRPTRKGDADTPTLKGVGRHEPKRVRGGLKGRPLKSRPRGPTLQWAFNVAGVGSVRPGDRRTRSFDSSGVLREKAANSSTTRGPKHHRCGKGLPVRRTRDDAEQASPPR